MSRRIGALTISQTPRADLLAPLYEALSDDEIIEAGALDFADAADLPDGSNAFYPLITTLTNGELVTLDRDFLTPLLQQALSELESQDVAISILLCAGDFPDVYGDQLLIKPTDMAQQTLQAMAMTRVAVISPIKLQHRPIESKWIRAGFDVLVWTMPPDLSRQQQAEWINSQLQPHANINCVVLDYVGYPTDSILTLQQIVNVPVFDLGHLAIAAMKALL